MVTVGIIMGSTSDYEVMQDACKCLEEFGVEIEKRVVSAHRTPDPCPHPAGRRRSGSCRPPAQRHQPSSACARAYRR